MKMNLGSEKHMSFRTGMRWPKGQRILLIRSVIVRFYNKEVSKTRGCNPLEPKRTVRFEIPCNFAVKLSKFLLGIATFATHCGTKGLQPLVAFSYKERTLL
jgi:hypothetical protein